MIVREERIGNQRLILGDCLAVMPGLGPVGHVISDPPYEAAMHAAKAHLTTLRRDGGPEMQPIDFDAIDPIRAQVVQVAAGICQGWFIAFCTPEGVGRWADCINASAMKYKRACVWVKPDSTPQMNGQGPAMGAESFVCAWAGAGHARWNAGGKRGVYVHNVNPPDRDGRHPTEKPVRLMAELLADFTAPGDVICDPFMGSGTTLVACARIGRAGVGIERDPKYFAIAVERLRAAQAEIDAQPGLFAPDARGPKAKQLKVAL